LIYLSSFDKVKETLLQSTEQRLRRSARLAAKAGKALPLDSPSSIERTRLDRLYADLSFKVEGIRMRLDRTHYPNSWEWNTAFEMYDTVREWREVDRLRKNLMQQK